MSDYTKQLTAEQLIRFIATDYVELSHEKIVWQRDEHIKICREWLQHQASNDLPGMSEYTYEQFSKDCDRW